MFFSHYFNSAKKFINRPLMLGSEFSQADGFTNLDKTIYALIGLLLIAFFPTQSSAQNAWGPPSQQIWTDPISGLTWTLCPAGLTMDRSGNCSVWSDKITAPIVKEHYKSSLTDSLDPLTEIRFRTYGVKALTVERIHALDVLEKTVHVYVKFNGDKAIWETNFNLILESVKDRFKISGLASMEGSEWSSWFMERFLPVYLEYLSGVKITSGTSDMVRGLSALTARQEIDLVIRLIATKNNFGKSVWTVERTPFYSEVAELNSNVVQAKVEALKARANAMDGSPGSAGKDGEGSSKIGSASISSTIARLDGIGRVVMQGAVSVGSDKREPVSSDWVGAVETAKNASVSGFNDWRLPSLQELSTVVKCTDNQQKILGDFSITSDSYERKIHCRGVGGQYRFLNGIYGNTGPSNSIWTANAIPNENDKARYALSFRYDTYGRASSAAILMVRGGKPSQEWLQTLADADPQVQASIKSAKAAEIKAQAAAAEAAQQRRQEELITLTKKRQEATERIRRSPKPGDNTMQGLVVAVKGDIVQVQTYRTVQDCRTYRGDGSCVVLGPRQTVPAGLVWMKKSELFAAP